MFAFPRTTGSDTSQDDAGRLVLRPFGRSVRDMDIDFQQPHRPCLVTELLQCCTVADTGKGEPETAEPGPGFFWGLTVSKRIEALLTLATSGGAEGLTVQLHCAYPACGELVEIDISLLEITTMLPPGEDTAAIAVQVRDSRYLFRKPTGNDQLRWLKGSFENEGAVVSEMIRTLQVPPDEPGKESGELSDGPFSPDWLTAVDEGMKAADPLVHFNLTLYCPACQKESTSNIDLENIATGKLQKIQSGLLHTVHRLASRYHWSEQQIFAVTPQRRTKYLALMDGEDHFGM